jgi:hypothetical protein
VKKAIRQIGGCFPNFCFNYEWPKIGIKPIICGQVLNILTKVQAYKDENQDINRLKTA